MKIAHLFFMLIVVFCFFMSSCNQNGNEDGSLDKVKAFVPDDKYFKSGLKSLHFVLETSSVDKADMMFSKSIDLYKLPCDAHETADGIYIGESPYDAFDYKHVVMLTLKGGSITNVNYNEVHKDGSDKKSDKKYNEQMNAAGTMPSIAYPNMERQLLDKQNMLQVDATSGATYSLYRFRYAVTLALMKARLAESK